MGRRNDDELEKSKLRMLFILFNFIIFFYKIYNSEFVDLVIILIYI